MAGGPPREVTRLLDSLGCVRRGRDETLLESTYGDLRRLARFLMAREPPGHTLQATALVNEAYLKLVGGEQVDWNDRRHFINTVARAMRHVLVDRARRRASNKRGGGRERVDLASIKPGTAHGIPVGQAEALEETVRCLEDANPRWGEILHLRYFAGLTIEQTAEVMEISPTLVKSNWKFARAWLADALRSAGTPT